MSTTRSCPNTEELRRLVAGTVAPEKQAALAQHIDGCPQCQAALEKLSAGSDSWSGIADHLVERAAVDPALANVMDRLQANPQETAAEPRRDDVGKLDFLEPAAQPGHLGRLAHYEVLDVVGKGGMGIVLRVHDTKLQRVSAIKVMMPELAAIASARQRFIREARAAAAVSHDHIVTIHAVHEDHSPPYLVMQYVAGRSLQQRIDDVGALELKEILRIGLQAASGLAAAHAQGLVHRDIKPANILLENGVERVKITDFGLARVGDDSRVTQTGVVTGTPQYMAPEQAKGETVDQRADLFSLGGVIYAMCTGYAPFRASSSMAVLKKVCDEQPRPIRDLNPEIPDWLVAIVEKLLAKDPKERFQSASEVAGLLGQNLAHLQQPSQVAMPARVEPVRTSSVPMPQTRRASLAFPILLMLAPLIIIPFVVVWANFSGAGKVRIAPLKSVICLSVLAAPCFLIGLVLLIGRLTSRPAAAPVAAGNVQALAVAKPNRSKAWVPILIVGVLLLIVCPLPLLGVAGVAFFVLWSSDRSHVDNQPNVDSYSLTKSDAGNEQESATRPTLIGDPPAELGRLAPWIPGVVNPKLIDGLDWFPAEATFCAAYSFEAAPAEVSDAIWHVAKSIPGPQDGSSPIADVTNAIGGGTITRLSYAYVDDPAGKRSRHFLRLTGSWNRDRVIGALVNHPRARSFELPFPAGLKVNVIVHDGIAFAVVGSSDIVLGGYERIPDGSKGHEEVVREALHCYDRTKRNLRQGTLGASLASTPGNAICLIAGELPKGPHEVIKKALGVLPQKVTITLVEGIGDGASFTLLPEYKDHISLRFNAVMNNKAAAEGLAKGSADWPKQFHEILDRSLKDAESRQAKEAGPKRVPALAKTATEFRAGPRIKAESKTTGFGVEGSVQVPPTVWRAVIALIKATPLSGSSTMPVQPVQLLKRFDPKVDKSVTTGISGRAVTTDDGGWRIESTDTSTKNEHLLHALPRVELHAMRRPDVDGFKVVLRAQLRTELVNSGAFLELDPGGGPWKEGTKYPLHASGGRIVVGSTNWSPYEVWWHCPDGTNPNQLRINLVINGTGTVWVKDLEVVKQPLSSERAPAAPPPVPKGAPAKEVPIKKFDPKKDKPLQTNINGRLASVEQDTWEIFSFKGLDKTEDVRLFELAKQDVRNGKVVLRFKMKTHDVTGRATAGLYIVGQSKSPSYLPERVRGGTDWKSYEIAVECKADLEPTTVIVVDDIDGTGLMWLKDVEITTPPLPAIPASPAPKDAPPKNP